MTAHDLHALVGDSTLLRQLRAVVAKIARTNMTVLIEGPTGSGKELVARALHTGSGRSGCFVAFNVCAIGEAMFEDALFGHVRGAFTGASRDSLGFLREANGGTAFLDEISGLPPALQAKLLRAVETGVFRPVGAGQDARSNARIVAATNEDIATLVADHRFRADLAHRLRAVTIRVPSLAEHVEDVPWLVRHFLEQAGFGALRVTPGALAALARRAWPGNIRELKHVVEWAAIVAQDALDEATLERAVATQGLHECPEGLTAEAEALRDALTRNGGNKELTAQELGVHLATVYRRIKKHRIIVDAPSASG